MCDVACCTCCNPNAVIGGIIGGSVCFALGLAVNYKYVQPEFAQLDGTNEDEAKALTAAIAIFSTLVGIGVGKVTGPIVIPMVACVGRFSSAVIKGLCFFGNKDQQASSSHATVYGTESVSSIA